MTRPEEVLALPLTHEECDCYTADETFYPRITANGSNSRTWNATAAALVTMCNAYPLALALADASRQFLQDSRSGLSGKDSREAASDFQAAIDAFLAHRQEAAR